MFRRWVIGFATVSGLMLVAPTPTFGGDAFLKVGLTVHPDVGGFTDRWLVSLGSDWGFNDTGHVGLEIQGAYRSNTPVGGALVDSAPANLFLNGKWKSETEKVRPFLGLGFGLMSTYVRTEVGGVTTSSYIKDGGFQLMGGIELHRTWVFELVGQRIFADGAQFHWAILAGRVW